MNDISLDSGDIIKYEFVDKNTDNNKYTQCTVHFQYRKVV